MVEVKAVETKAVETTAVEVKAVENNAKPTAHPQKKSYNIADINALAKEIRQDGMSWNDAQRQAAQILKNQ